MNVVEFVPATADKRLVFCIVDNTRQYQSSIRELVKNQADGVLANIYNKGYPALVWINEDELLSSSADMGYEYAVVLSTGTEFINGYNFFDEVDKILQQDFFIAGHILDRQEGYYELHHQCYVINLQYYRKLDKPKVGQQQFFVNKFLSRPARSQENFHDDYTPTWISATEEINLYKHCCHGWNLIDRSLANNLNCLVFNNEIRNSKIFLYPESPADFYKQISWVYDRLHYCQTEFVHTKATEHLDLKGQTFEQIVTPASSDWFVPYINQGRVIYYDYNKKSLEYWKQHCPKIDSVEFEFVQCDLLGSTDFVDYIDVNKKTLVNLSNVFNYEGTYVFYSQNYRQYKQDKLVEKILEKCPSTVINFSMPAKVSQIIPTWHL